MSTQHAEEVRRGDRFQFGANWSQFLGTLTDERIGEAEQSLRDMLGVEDLCGRSFLDIGSGSGLFSLAARRLGAEVHSFDFDPKSVECGQELRRRYFPDDTTWTVEEGSALDEDYVSSLGKFDFVYSWGVLHHTGDMETALLNASIPVEEGGVLFVAIYNDQDVSSSVWKAVKKTFCSGRLGRAIVSSTYMPYFAAQSVAIGLVKFGSPMGMFDNYKQRRGMSIYHDWIDWLGGYPFEVARPEEIFHLYKKAGFVLENLITTNRMGCNEFVFRKSSGK